VKEFNSKDMFEKNFQYSIDLLCIADKDGYIIKLNPEWEKTFGYDTSEIEGENYLDYVHPEDLKETENVLNNLADNEIVIDFINRNRCKDGSYKWLQWRSFPYENLIYASARDITAQKKAEEKNKMQRMHLVNAVTLAKIGYWEYDIAKDIFTFNDYFYKVYRTTAEKVGGYQMSIARYVELMMHPDDAQKVAEETLKAIETDDPNFVGYTEHRIIFPDGEIGYVAVRYSILKDKNGKTIGTVGTNQDITEQVIAKRKLKEQNAEYEKLNNQYIVINKELRKSVESIQRINNELILAKEKAEESDKLKTAFLANLSHEIRTPMNGILGFANILKNENVHADTAAQYFDLIGQCGERMLSMINDLVDISKIEAGQVIVEPQITDLNKLIYEIGSFFKHQADQKGLRFTFENADYTTAIYIDKVKLEQVLSNLLNNAIKFTEQGHIEFTHKLKNNVLLFGVKDTGYGIPEGMEEVIFERFRQAEDNYLRASDGSGLGLSISKSFVEKMGGKIWVKSEYGKGAEFFVRLPVSPIDLQKNSKINTNEPQFKKALTVLIAEDDLVNMLLLKRVLSERNFTIIDVNNGEAAIDQFYENPHIDVILMDLKMPKMNGIDAVVEIRKRDAKIPIIAQTGFTSEHDKQKALEAGCNDYITKPIKVGLLLEKIKNAVKD